MRSNNSWAAAVGALVLCGALLPSAGLGQVVVVPEVGPAAPSPEMPAAGTPRPVSPGGAFVRAVLVPGWGHASIGAYNRGGFYFVLEGVTAYSLIRTRKRIAEVDARAVFRESVLRSDLLQQGITVESEVTAALDDDATLEGLRDLADSRRNQQEDWVALGLFLLFLSGADAYVSTHLADFPTPIELNAQPAPAGGMEVGFRIRLGN